MKTPQTDFTRKPPSNNLFKVFKFNVHRCFQEKAITAAEFNSFNGSMEVWMWKEGMKRRDGNESPYDSPDKPPTWCRVLQVSYWQRSASSPAPLVGSTCCPLGCLLLWYWETRGACVMLRVAWPYFPPYFLLFYSKATMDKYHMSHSKKLFLCLHSGGLFILVH